MSRSHAPRQTPQYWSNHLELWVLSGMSVRDYCAAHQLNYNTSKMHLDEKHKRIYLQTHAGPEAKQAVDRVKQASVQAVDETTLTIELHTQFRATLRRILNNMLAVVIQEQKRCVSQKGNKVHVDFVDPDLQAAIEQHLSLFDNVYRLAMKYLPEPGAASAEARMIAETSAILDALKQGRETGNYKTFEAIAHSLQSIGLNLEAPGVRNNTVQ